MTSLNDQFEGMTSAQRAYILSMLVNKVLKNPVEYGLGGDGILRVGDELDFTKLFENIREIQSLFDKAKQTISPGSPQEKSILANNEKIANWIKENPNAKLTNDKVPEILNNETKIKDIPETEPSVSTEKTGSGAETPSKETVEVIRKQMQEEIKKAEERIAELEANKESGPTLIKEEKISEEVSPTSLPNPHIERTLYSDKKTQAMGAAIEAAFNEEINNIYGVRKLWKRESGIDNPEWIFMSRLPAGEVLQYARKDSNQSKLSIDVSALNKSNKHQKFINTMLNLIEEAGSDFKPYEKERVDEFFKRLGGFVMEKHTQNNG